MDLLLIPVTNVLDEVLNHAKEKVGSDWPDSIIEERMNEHLDMGNDLLFAKVKICIYQIITLKK